MGLGLQKWIYSRTPRTKMYVRNKLPSFTPLPKYSRKFQLKASIKENKFLGGLLAIGIALFMIFLSSSSLKKFTDYSNEYSRQVIGYNNYENEKAFNFLIKSGTYRLEENKSIEAYSEFKLAYSIHQNNEYLNHLLIETLSTLCDDNQNYCDELDVFLLDKV